MKDKVLSFPVRRNDDRFAYDTRGQVTAAVLRAITPHAVPAGYAYDAFGQTVSSTGPMREVFPHRFSTKWHDDYLGMVDYGRRWYHPRMGRWISRDPIEEEGGENLYLYCINNPQFFSDRNGESIVAAAGFIGFIASLIALNPDVANAPGVGDMTYPSMGVPIETPKVLFLPLHNIVLEH